MADSLTHRATGGDFGQTMALLYTVLRHGHDGRQLLDGIIKRLIEHCAKPGTVWADPGGGSGWISVLLAQHGVQVKYSDINPTFVAKATDAVREAGVEALVEICCADVASLPYGDGSVDFVISSNVGCAVPSLAAMLREAARILRPGGTIILTAPASLDQIFTVDGDEELIAREFAAALAAAADEQDIGPIVLAEKRVHRATIEWANGRAALVRGRQLCDGARIYRAISGPMCVPNFWHGDEAYDEAVAAAGLVLPPANVFAEILTPASRAELNAGKPLEQTLGSRYETHAAFRVRVATKPA